MPTIGWYLKRLRVMAPRELLYRVGQLWTLLSLFGQYKLGVGLAKPPSDSARFRFCYDRKALLPPLIFDLVGLKDEAVAITKGEIPVGGGMWQWEDCAGIWHRAPDTGRIWPDGFFGSIHYREGNPIGDVRQVWEPSRLQQLVDLAMIARTCGAVRREQAVHMLKAQLTSWVSSNPPLAGVQYVSAMECALRIISVCHALDMLRDEMEDDAVWLALVRIVGSHAPLIERRLSLYSSTGNHTVAEAAGLVYAGLLFPEMARAEKWLNNGISVLTEVATNQVLPDGGGVEQSLDYHLFNIQLFSLVNALMHKHSRQMPSEISTAVDRGSRFLGTMGFDAQYLPAIGDSDGGHALSRFLKLVPNSDGSAIKTRTFPDAGYSVAQIGRRPAVGLVFDHGPLGMPPAYGHGHADALSLLLRVNGEQVLVDPGTYTYTGDQNWRRYFRGTRAHNTITVGGDDQARQESCFKWSNSFSANLIASEIDGNADGRLVAQHDGYRDIGVRHVRGIAWAQDQWLVIRDYVFGDGVLELQLHWHLGAEPDWQDSENFELPIPGGALAVRCQGGELSAHRGQRSPMIGWRSPSYGTIEPITTMRISQHGPLPHKFTTLIKLPGCCRPETAIEDALEWIKDQAH